jgi:glyceraldehyde 3-phosphate dehydrogenase
MSWRMVTDETLLKIDAWDDTEMGYTCRMVDLDCHMEATGL